MQEEKREDINASHSANTYFSQVRQKIADSFL